MTTTPEPPEEIAQALSRVPPRARQFYETLQAAGRPLIAEEIVEALRGAGEQIGRGSTGRMDNLHREGLIEAAGKGRTVAGRPATRWRVVPADRVEEVRRKAERKPKRRRTIDDLTAHEAAQAVRRLVTREDVNALLLADERQSRSSRRARRESQSYNQRARQLDAEIRQAQREKSSLLKFLQAKRLMEDATESLRGMCKKLSEEIDARDGYGEAEIPDDRWVMIRGLAGDHRVLAAALEQEISSMLGDNAEEEEDIIDVEAIDDVDFELPPGT